MHHVWICSDKWIIDAHHGLETTGKSVYLHMMFRNFSRFSVVKYQYALSQRLTSLSMRCKLIKYMSSVSC